MFLHFPCSKSHSKHIKVDIVSKKSEDLFYELMLALRQLILLLTADSVYGRPTGVGFQAAGDSSIPSTSFKGRVGVQGVDVAIH